MRFQIKNTVIQVISTITSQRLELSKYTETALITCNKLIGHIGHRKSICFVLVDMEYHTPVQSNLQCCTEPCTGWLALSGTTLILVGSGSHTVSVAVYIAHCLDDKLSQTLSQNQRMTALVVLLHESKVRSYIQGHSLSVAAPVLY